MAARCERLLFCLLYMRRVCWRAREREEFTCFLLHSVANDAGDDDDNDHDEEDVDDDSAVAEDAVTDVDAVNVKNKRCKLQRKKIEKLFIFFFKKNN